MLAPLDLEHIFDALRVPQGWIELLVIAACFAIAWAIDRRERVTRRGDSQLARISAGSINRLIFPVAAFVLLLVTGAVFKRWHAPVFFQIFIPLAVALALIRLTVYAFRNLLGTHVDPTLSERAVTLFIWGTLVSYYLGVLPEIASALDDARMPLGKREFSVLDLLRDAIVIVLAIAVAVWGSNLLQKRLMRFSHVDNNVRVLLSKIGRALLILIGVLVALSFVGIDVTVLSVFGGALGVGIGLGLQKLASNYIAGFTILLDRSIRVGDMITVDGQYGAVSQVTSRYVVVRSLNGVEAIVPNERLITTTVLNHSYTSSDVQVGVPVQISNDSDLELAMRVLREIGAAQERVLTREGVEPAVNILRFAENGIELELVVWINDPLNGQGNLKSALYLRIWKAFREHGIKMPNPQRDIRIVAAPPAGEAPPTTE